jgi:hypothetical protein
MGLSIHYKGKLKNYTSTDELIAEAEDICKSMGWKHTIMQPDEERGLSINSQVKLTPHDVKGITISPEECEPIILSFLPDGNLVNWVKLIHYNHLTNDLAIEWVHTKTQFAGPDTHIAVVKFLHYISKKYFSDFEMNDEGYYWEKWDEQILLARFKKYNFLLDAMADALANVKLAPGESAVSLADRIEQIIKDKFGDDNIEIRQVGPG